MQKNDTIYTVDGSKKGHIINPDYRVCRENGCQGKRIIVRWEDNRVSYPCSSMIKEVKPNIYQVCTTKKQLQQSGWNLTDLRIE